MPCDPELESAWVTDTHVLTKERVTLQDPGGDTHTGYRASITTDGARQIVGYVPHWASCSERDAFRRR